MKILSIGGSNSKKSINKQLADFATDLFQSKDVVKLDLSKIEIPIYSIDNEESLGIPKEIIDFAEKIDQSDMIVISLAENNGSFNVGLKNILDWTSRIKDRKTFNNKSMLLMATSPGARGGATVLETAKSLFPYSGANVKATFSLPEFYKNFDVEKGITNEELLSKLNEIVIELKK